MCRYSRKGPGGIDPARPEGSAEPEASSAEAAAIVNAELEAVLDRLEHQLDRDTYKPVRARPGALAHLRAFRIGPFFNQR